VKSVQNIDCSLLLVTGSVRYDESPRHSRCAGVCEKRLSGERNVRTGGHSCVAHRTVSRQNARQ